MIPVTYSYLCSCGYYVTRQETLQPHPRYPEEPGALNTVQEYRLTIDQALLCAKCHKQLQPTVVVTYAPLPPKVKVSERNNRMVVSVEGEEYVPTLTTLLEKEQTQDN